VTFHDGSPFNAEAVSYSLKRTMVESLACETAIKYFTGFKIEAVPVDADTIDFKTDIPVPILPTMMGSLGIMATATPLDEITREPIGTGPYTLKEWTPGQRIVLARYDRYWGEKPTVTGANYVWREDSAVRAAMVASGEADIAPNIAVQDATDPKMDFSYLNSETSSFRIDAMLAPLNDVRVRKALNLAIDRDAMRGTIFSANVIPATQLVVPGINGHNDDLVPYPYDPEQAKKLLDEARADGVPVDNEIVIVGRTDIYPNASEVDQALLAMYQAIGLNVSLKMVEAAEWYKLAFKPFPEDRKPFLFQTMHDNNNGDAVFTIATKYHSESGQSAISVPKLDALIDAAGVATGDERREKYEEAFRMIHEDIVADVELFHMVGFTRVNPRLNFTPSISTNSELQLAHIAFK
jgi:peptide/nickel transport system substrate-binding protein